MGTTMPTARLGFRIDAQTKARLERAAALCNQTVSDFAKSALASKAAEAIQRSRVTLLTDEEWQRFMKMVDSDAEPNAKLKRAAKRCRAGRARSQRVP